MLGLLCGLCVIGLEVYKDDSNVEWKLIEKFFF